MCMGKTSEAKPNLLYVPQMHYESEGDRRCQENQRHRANTQAART